MRVVIDVKDFEKKLNIALQGIGNDTKNALQSKLGLPNDPTGETKFGQRGKFTGNLQSKISYSIEQNNKVNITMPEYAEYLEYGTPHPVDNVDGLRDWVRLKLLKGKHVKDKTIDKITLAIAKKIEEQGSRPFPFIRLTFKQDVNEIVERNLIRAFRL